MKLRTPVKNTWKNYSDNNNVSRTYSRPQSPCGTLRFLFVLYFNEYMRDCPWNGKNRLEMKMSFICEGRVKEKNK